MNVPQHVAVIMDGNGRWAKQRHLPRIAGHQQGLESVRAVIATCLKQGIAHLTLFTFSSENWQRPENEIGFLFGILLRSLRVETKSLHKNQVCLKIVGDKTPFSQELLAAIEEAEALTKDNTKLRLNIAFNYGGRWDLVNAARVLSTQVAANLIESVDISEDLFKAELAFADCPDPEFLIRTGGEYRISNFLLWQFAYTELYFTDIYWPDFREAQFEAALQIYGGRQRRFGSIEESIEESIEAIEDQTFLP